MLGKSLFTLYGNEELPGRTIEIWFFRRSDN